MTHDEKLLWMLKWCKDNDLVLQLSGECGFGRKCVGVLADDLYPDYEWLDDDYERVDENGEVWIPEDAYHKHPCVAVLGRGKEIESQLYEWLKWFDENGFVLETGELTPDPNMDDLTAFLLGKTHYARMVKRND